MKHSKEQIQTKIDALKFIIKSINNRALWFQHYSMSESCNSALQLVEELEREFLDDPE